MKGLFIFTVLCLASVALSSNVVVLTPDNFDSVVDGSKYVFVEFYAPWCGHCKNLAPEYEIFANAFEKISDVVIANFDADAHKAFSKKFGVTGYPTLKFFPKTTEPEDYHGGRTSTDLIDFVNGKVPKELHGRAPPPPPTDVVVLTPENFDSIVLDSSKHVFVEFYAPWCGHCKRLTPTWEKLAGIFKGDEDVVIAKLDSEAHKDLANKYDVSGYPTLKFFAKDSKEGDRYSGARDLKDFLNFLGEKTGVIRSEDGSLAPKVGVVDSVSKLLKTYISEKSDSAAAAVTEAISALPEEEKKFGIVYSKILESVKSKEGYVQNEISRLERILKGNLTKAKISEFSLKLNILKSLL